MLLFSDGPYPGLCISLEVVLCEKCCCLVMDHIPSYVGVVLCEKCCCLNVVPLYQHISDIPPTHRVVIHYIKCLCEVQPVFSDAACMP